MKSKLFLFCSIALFGIQLHLIHAATKEGKPNILWIVVEDASPHISCYGETAIETPNIDALAREGVKFTQAFITCPVCSPARSALVTGMYQTTIGAHNHRSQRESGKGGGNTAYYDSYRLPDEILLASQLFEDAGYYTSNEKMAGGHGKQDYNFVAGGPANYGFEARDIYAGTSWKDSPEGIPFFSQIQLRGGKNRQRLAETENFNLPPYYYEDEVMREDWKEYLGSWLDTDRDVRQIMGDLKKAGVYDNTLIVFLTDHGISHLRGKQFLYDEGIHIPLIVKFPGGKKKGTVREDLVKHIDILPTSMAVAGIAVPETMQGVDLFAPDYQPQEFIVSARDRCDETTEIIRSVRTRKYKYIRNFLSFLPHAQRNQYKDGKLISRHMRELYEAGKLSELQARFYQSPRPPEELYDLEKDPFEINNLADDPAYRSVLEELRSTLYAWMDQTNDPGLIPEPWLEELGRKYGSKYAAMKDPEYEGINERLISVVEAGEQANLSRLMDATASKEPSVVYWGATWLGELGNRAAVDELQQLTDFPLPSVRIAANLALIKIGGTGQDHMLMLSRDVKDPNLIAGMYAINAIEKSGIRNEQVLEIAQEAAESPYEFTRRFGRYLVSEMNKVAEK